MVRYDYPYLKDKVFLKKVDNLRIREQYVKITALTFDEHPIQAIEGIVTNGSINVDGASAVRRTCNFTMIADGISSNVLEVENVISINKKISVEIGIKNTLSKYTEYPILWFPQGIYVITSPSISHGVDGTTISIQAQDKMCLLNGDVGGVLPAAIILNEIENYNGLDVKVDGQSYTVGEFQLMKNNLFRLESDKSVESLSKYTKRCALVNTFLSDLNVKSSIEQPKIYQIIQELVHHWGGEQLGNILISDIPNQIKQSMQWVGDTPLYQICPKGFENSEGAYFTTNEPTDLLENAKEKTVIKYNYGDSIGFTYADFIYPGELSSAAGDSICTILDKIRDTLGNYEYFYDLNGNFVFREKKNFLNTTQAKTELNNMQDQNYALNMSKGKTIYDFSDGTIISSYSSSPQYGMIKNDFIVWGQKETATGQKVPIRYHLAIDDKPKVVDKEVQCIHYIDSLDKTDKYVIPIIIPEGQKLKIPGLSGVLYRHEKDPNDVFYIYDEENKIYRRVVQQDESEKVVTITPKDWRTQLYLNGQQAVFNGIDSNYYFAELANEWTQLYDIVDGDFRPEFKTNPTNAQYFLDFIDSGTAISRFSVSNIGRRTKVVSDDSINCIFEPAIPDWILINTEADNAEQQRGAAKKDGQKYIQVNEYIYDRLIMGSNFNSAYNAVRELLYQYTGYNESVSIQVLPIYYLEPNVRISINDVDSGIHGEYIINSYTIPLEIGGSMSISCSKAIERV